MSTLETRPSWRGTLAILGTCIGAYLFTCAVLFGTLYLLGVIK